MKNLLSRFLCYIFKIGVQTEPESTETFYKPMRTDDIPHTGDIVKSATNDDEYIVTVVNRNLHTVELLSVIYATTHIVDLELYNSLFVIVPSDDKEEEDGNDL